MVTGEEEGQPSGKVSSWDAEGWLVQHSFNHKGSMDTRVGMMDANKLLKQVCRHGWRGGGA